MRLRGITFGCVAGLLGSSSLVAQMGVAAPGWPTCGENEIEVVLFGTFHMAGSRDDLASDVDNMLSERRQSEMGDVIDWLVAMRPDRIGVEILSTDQPELSASYDGFRRGDRELSANEVEQLGFRTAVALGHDEIYAIDFRIGIGNDSISAFYSRHPEVRARNDPISAKVTRAMAMKDERLAASPLLEYLRWTNLETTLRAEGNRAMYAHLIAGEDGNYGGADLYTKWYERNSKMAHNVSRIAPPSETERVLVIVGAGHVRPLRDVFDLSPHFCPVSPLSSEP